VGFGFIGVVGVNMKTLKILTFFVLVTLGFVSIVSAQTPEAKSSYNFDGKYERRGDDGKCCYETVDVNTGLKTGRSLSNANLIIKGKVGEFTLLGNDICNQGTYRVDSIETNGDAIAFWIRREEHHNAQRCNFKDELVQFRLNTIDGRVGFSPPRRMSALMYKRVSD
jgi:hypothetical protein